VASEKVNNTTKLHNHEWTYSSCVAPGVVLSKFGNQQAKNWARAPFRITLKISRSQARIVSSAKKKKNKETVEKKEATRKEVYENNCRTTTATKLEENRPRGEGEKQKNFIRSRKQAVEIKEPVDPETGDRNYSTGDRPSLAALLIT